MGEHLFTFKLDIKLPWFINSDIVWSKYYIKTIQHKLGIKESQNK